MSTIQQPTPPRVIHVIAPYLGASPLRIRQAMFLESIDRARSDDVLLLAVANGEWHRPGWHTHRAGRTAAALGDGSDKPFLKDLLDIALAAGSPDDWLLYSNVDCSFARDLYTNLQSRRATVVEYQRQDVDGNPTTLDELLARPGVLYRIGVDGLAIRASLYREVRDDLPDFVIGEPHWDTIYSGFFRRILPVQRDCERLFHPKHEQVWDLANLTVAGDHNQQLFVDSMNRGLADKTMIEDVRDRTDTAVIVAVFGANPQRIDANIAGLRKQLEQDLYSDLFLVELLENGLESAYPEDLLRSVRHVAIPASPSSGGLFQKEALYNRGWRTALEQGDYDYFIFLDADVYCDSRDWFRRIRARLRDNPSSAVQGWRTVKDTLDPQLLFSSVAAAFVLDQPTDLPLNPGICWGLHRTLLEAGDGFNPYCLDCAGDSAFVAEYLNTPTQQYDPWLYQFRWFREIERPLSFHAEIDCVPLDVVHVHHGLLQDRNYDSLRYALDAFPPVPDLIHLNGHGILEWRDSTCLEREILQHRGVMTSRAAVDDLLERFEYPRYSGPAFDARPTAVKRPFAATLHNKRRSPAVHTATSATRDSIKIFDPQQVLRKDFPFSWCDGVIKAETSTYAPLQATDTGAVLVLTGKPGAPYVVCALPLQPTWLPVDISSREHLCVGLRVTGTPPDVLVSLVSQAPGSEEVESRVCSLKAEGLRYGRWQNFALPLTAFRETVDLRTVRLVKFVGFASFGLELRRIYIR